MTLDIIDTYASKNNSILHCAPVWLKLVFAILFLAITLWLQNTLLLFAFYCLLNLLIFVGRLPYFKVLVISLFPLFFALLFALSGDWFIFLFVIFKVLCTVLTVLLLVFTTPVTKLFATLSPILPSFFVSALFLTYRSIFILFYIFENTQRALRIRGGINNKHPLRSLNNLASAVGHLIVTAISASENMYQSMRMRGFNGKVYYGR